jgi:hypothetical protein
MDFKTAVISETNMKLNSLMQMEHYVLIYCGAEDRI